MLLNLLINMPRPSVSKSCKSSGFRRPPVYRYPILGLASGTGPHWLIIYKHRLLKKPGTKVPSWRPISLTGPVISPLSGLPAAAACIFISGCPDLSPTCPVSPLHSRRSGRCQPSQTPASLLQRTPQFQFPVPVPCAGLAARLRLASVCLLEPHSHLPLLLSFLFTHLVPGRSSGSLLCFCLVNLCHSFDCFFAVVCLRQTAVIPYHNQPRFGVAHHTASLLTSGSLLPPFDFEPNNRLRPTGRVCFSPPSWRPSRLDYIHCKRKRKDF